MKGETETENFAVSQSRYKNIKVYDFCLSLWLQSLDKWTAHCKTLPSELKQRCLIILCSIPLFQYSCLCEIERHPHHVKASQGYKPQLSQRKSVHISLMSLKTSGGKYVFHLSLFLIGLWEKQEILIVFKGARENLYAVLVEPFINMAWGAAVSSCGEKKEQQTKQRLLFFCLFPERSNFVRSRVVGVCLAGQCTLGMSGRTKGFWQSWGTAWVGWSSWEAWPQAHKSSLGQVNVVHLPTGSKGGLDQGPFAFFSEPQRLSQECINTCEYVMQCLIACNDTNILIMLTVWPSHLRLRVRLFLPFLVLNRW